MSEPVIINPNDINPNHDWGKPVPAPGHMTVDVEERVNFNRLHKYRLGRAKEAL